MKTIGSVYLVQLLFEIEVFYYVAELQQLTNRQKVEKRQYYVPSYLKKDMTLTIMHFVSCQVSSCRRISFDVFVPLR